MTSQARNQNPLHVHTAQEMRLYPWTQDTLSAHLTYLHGVDDLPLDRSLENLAALHDALNHGTPAKTDEQILAEALAPERRYKSITLGPARWGYPGDVALHFEDLNENGTNIVNLRHGDMPALRAAVIPEDPDLEAITEAATAGLGPAAAKYVQQAHARGYRLGVDDMEATSVYRTAPVTAAEVISFLEGRDSGVLPSAVHRAISAVLDILRNEEPA